MVEEGERVHGENTGKYTVDPDLGPLAVLRDEYDGPHDRRHLEAYFNEAGDLMIHGHDLGPATAPVSDTGDYEWFRIVRAPHVPTVLTALGGEPGENILEFLAREYSGPASYDLEARFRETDLPCELQVR